MIEFKSIEIDLYYVNRREIYLFCVSETLLSSHSKIFSSQFYAQSDANNIMSFETNVPLGYKTGTKRNKVANYFSIQIWYSRFYHLFFNNYNFSENLTLYHCHCDVWLLICSHHPMDMIVFWYTYQIVTQREQEREHWCYKERKRD